MLELQIWHQLQEMLTERGVNVDHTTLYPFGDPRSLLPGQSQPLPVFDALAG